MVHAIVNVQPTVFFAGLCRVQVHRECGGKASTIVVGLLGKFILKVHKM